jgi:hypothetical protein
MSNMLEATSNKAMVSRLRAGNYADSWVRFCQACDPALPANPRECEAVLARVGDVRFVERADTMTDARFRAAWAFAVGKSEQRLPSYTRSGEAVLLDYPDITKIVTDDFLALADIRRYGSYAGTSVANHLLNCVAIARSMAIPWGPVFAHDLQELYVGEVPTGCKSMLRGFKGYEELWSQRIHAHYGVEPTAEAQRQVRACDMMALAWEVLVVGDHPAGADIVLDAGVHIGHTSMEFNGFTCSLMSVHMERRTGYEAFRSLLRDFADY